MASACQSLDRPLGPRDGRAPSSVACADLAQRDFVEHHIEYAGFMSNHLAHGLVALHQLGASAERMDDFYPHASQHLEARRPATGATQPLTRDNFVSSVGRVDFTSCVHFLQQEWTRIAVDLDPEATNDADTLKRIEQRLVAELFPRLAFGIAGHATHPLIHIGFGLVMTSEVDPPMWSHLRQGEGGRAQNPMVVTGLAYLIYQGVRLDAGTGGYSPASMDSIPHANTKPLHTVLADAIEKLGPWVGRLDSMVAEKPYSERAGGQFQRKVAVLADHAAQDLLRVDAQWRIDSIDLAVDELRSAVLLLYGVSDNDFFMLHGVTSLYALRHILPKLAADADRIVALRYGLKMLLAVFAVQGLPAKESKALQTFAQSGDVQAAAQQAMDEQPEFLKQGRPTGGRREASV